VTKQHSEEAPRRALLTAAIILGTAFSLAAYSGWRDKVPEEARQRMSPIASEPDAAAAGAKLFAQHCASCHGKEAEGRGKRPGLHSEHVQGSTDGELFWLLTNGQARYGMPSWSRLPEPQRWQVVAFLKSLD
jgi:mono/diheme cytochrome c family protein